MARMVRKQISITDELDHQLESLAASMHVSQAAVVRSALEAYVERAEQERCARSAAAARFVEIAREISEQMPSNYRRLTREELNDREFVRRLERDHLFLREGQEE